MTKKGVLGDMSLGGRQAEERHSQKLTDDQSLKGGGRGFCEQ